MVAAAFGRPDEQGRMVVEFSTPRFETYVTHFRRHQQDYLPGVADSDRLAQASQSRAWRSERIETVFSFARDARAEPWRAAAQEVGFRSAASIPLRDGEDRMVAILSVYGAYPNQFESHWIQRHLGRNAASAAPGAVRSAAPTMARSADARGLAHVGAAGHRFASWTSHPRRGAGAAACSRWTVGQSGSVPALVWRERNHPAVHPRPGQGAATSARLGSARQAHCAVDQSSARSAAAARLRALDHPGPRARSSATGSAPS
ncbi:MAG: hypothetical protein B7X43_05315 [Thiomonas sp. 15-63-373]|nr:MAG: hypothetical protein B7X43_05315 [Thiomonas sp. 15-63-373]